MATESIFLPLNFWFNTDTRVALPVIIIRFPPAHCTECKTELEAQTVETAPTHCVACDTALPAGGACPECDTVTPPEQNTHAWCVTCVKRQPWPSEWSIRINVQTRPLEECALDGA